MSGYEVPVEMIMLAGIFDKVSWLAWAQTKEAQEGGKPPEPIVGKLLGVEPERKANLTFTSPEDYYKKLEEINNGRI